MMRATVLAVLLVLSAAPAAQAAGIADLLTRPELKPFITAVMGIKECLTDPAIAQLKFDLDKCPSLTTILKALNKGNTNPPVACELSCVRQFDKLNATCYSELRDTFSADKTDIGRLGSSFFEACDETKNGPGSPAMSPGMAPVPAPEPMPAEWGPVEAPAPAPSPASGAFSSAALPTALLSLLAAAAYALL